jgi:UDPglucose 6-dehydrogenase
MRIAMVGTGYVGLVSGTRFADFGHRVICVDRDVAKIGKLRQGEIPIYEPGLTELVQSNFSEGRLAFCTVRRGPLDLGSRVLIACPFTATDGHAGERSRSFAQERSLMEGTVRAASAVRLRMASFW